MNKELLKDMTYGMYVLTTNYKGRDVGCFVNTAIQITSSSMLIGVSVNKNNYTNEAIKHSKIFSISVLSEKTNPEVIGKFGFFSSREVDKFEKFKSIKVNGLSVVNEDICGYMVCELVDIVSVDTHDLFIAKIIDSCKLNNLPPMTYDYYHKVIKGSAPKTAPTFIEEPPVSAGNFKRYRCIICGHIYDEAVEKVRFKDLPNNWTCPICGVGKEDFEEIK